MAIGVASAEEALVRFSDGRELRGELAPVPGSRLILHDGEHRRELQADQLAAIAVEIEHERLVRRWRFIEPGKPQKEEVGEPRPLRDYRVVVSLVDGSQLAGHLQTVMFKLRGEEGSTKVLLRAQHKGEEGEALADLVYPQLLRWPRAIAEAEPTRLVPPVSVGALREMVALTRPGLGRFEAEAPAVDGGAWRLPPLGGRPCFLAARGADGLLVTWPEEEVAGDDRKRFEAAIAAVEDFFDGRELRGLWRDPADGMWYSLVLLRRERRSTSVKPWRLTVWRWLEDEHDGRLQVAGRMHLLRGLPEEAGPPALRLSAAWWRTEALCGAAP